MYEKVYNRRKGSYYADGKCTAHYTDLGCLQICLKMPKFGYKGWACSYNSFSFWSMFNYKV